MDAGDLITPDAIDAAAEVFWREGYDRASIDDIVRATGLNRYALYQKFGGKRDLYIAALRRYHEKASAEITAALAAPDTSPLEAMRAGLYAEIEQRIDNKAACMLCDAAIETGARDESIARFIEVCFSEMRQMFKAIVARAQAEGEARRDIPAAAGATLLFSTVMAMGVQSRLGASPDELKTLVDDALTALQPPKPD